MTISQVLHSYTKISYIHQTQLLCGDERINTVNITFLLWRGFLLP